MKPTSVLGSVLTRSFTNFEDDFKQFSFSGVDKSAICLKHLCKIETMVDQFPGIDLPNAEDLI